MVFLLLTERHADSRYPSLFEDWAVITFWLTCSRIAGYRLQKLKNLDAGFQT
tara:strand:+ start:850 stop:1005 length:156 start_codon:yes stop_codon:yes gene_type:complete